MARSIAIVGRHPVLEPGFNAAMSINEALGFEAHGCKVTLYLAVAPQHDPYALLERSPYTSFDQLPRYGGNFEIVPFRTADEVCGADVMVWQSYQVSEHPLMMSFAGRSMLRTKSWPRVFRDVESYDRPRAKGMVKQLDLIALAHRIDRRIIANSVPELRRHYQYVPRGFVPDWLSGAARDAVPTFGMDRAVEADDGGARAQSHIVEVVKRLRPRLEELRVLSVLQTVPEIGSEEIPHLPLRDYYDRFLNRLWIYFPIDFEHSIHKSGYTTDGAGLRMFTGLYENQVVEAQLAGALVVVRRGDIARELLMLPNVSVVDDYEDIDAIERCVLSHLDEFAKRSQQSRALARERHSHVEMTRRWLAAMDRVR